MDSECHNDYYRMPVWFHTLSSAIDDDDICLKRWSDISVELGVAGNDVRQVFDFVLGFIGNHRQRYARLS